MVRDKTIVFIQNTLIHTSILTSCYCPIDVFGFVASASLTLKRLTFSILFFGIALTKCHTASSTQYTRNHFGCNVTVYGVHNCTFQHQAVCLLCECVWLAQLQVQIVLAKACELAIDVCVIQSRLIAICVYVERRWMIAGGGYPTACMRLRSQFFSHCHTLIHSEWMLNW